MYKLTALISFYLCFAAVSTAQNTSVLGIVTDTLQKKGLHNAVVALLSTNDSLLRQFTRTSETGSFLLTGVKPGNYILLATHPYFADVIQNISVSSTGLNAGEIAMTSKSKLLAEVIVKTGTPIRIKGDTTVYTADSFRVRPGANVEELLKRLPGIQVDKSGKITAMGEQVKKVLVDGEEFFGDDPGIATKNIQANIVKEVEVYDKKSDQATFTGIDDGVKDKTINLKLKDNAKKGYFGKMEAGTDFKKYYNNSAMINAFRDKRKMAAYGIMSNTGQTNLDWQDAQSFGGGSNNVEITDDGGMMIRTSTDDDEDNYYQGRGGIPTNWNGGLHYSNKFNNAKQSLNTGYKFTKVNSPSGQTTYTQNFLGDSSYSTNTTSTGYSSKFRQSFNGSFETMLDSANSLKFTVKGNTGHSNNLNDYGTESLTPDNLLINQGNRHSSSIQDNMALNGTGLWKHKFKKKSRTLSFNASFSLSQSKSNSVLFSGNNFFKTGIPLSSDTTDQKNIRNNRTSSYSATAVYTEPLSKTVFMSLNYTASLVQNTNDRSCFAKDAGGNYTLPIDSLSNNYQYNQVSNKPGINFRMNGKKTNIGIGTSLAFNNFQQNNLTTGSNRDYYFMNIYPTASLNLKMAKNQYFRFNYEGSSTAPSLNQLQPVTDNTDVLNQYVGNPNLKQSFNHDFGLSYNFYNVLKERSLWTNIWSNLTQNAFVSETTTDLDSAKTVNRTVNADGVYNINFNFEYGFKLKKSAIRMSLGPNMIQSRNITYLVTKQAGSPLLDQTSVNHNSKYGMHLNLNKGKEDKYDLNINTTAGITLARSSVNSQANATYRWIKVNAEADLTILKKYELHSDINYETRQKDPRFPSNSTITLWNATLGRKFFKDALEAGITVNDILGQKRGFERNFTDNRYTETYYNTLKRYGMFVLSWNFNKNHPKSGD